MVVLYISSSSSCVDIFKNLKVICKFMNPAEMPIKRLAGNTR